MNDLKNYKLDRMLTLMRVELENEFYANALMSYKGCCDLTTHIIESIKGQWWVFTKRN